MIMKKMIVALLGVMFILSSCSSIETFFDNEDYDENLYASYNIKNGEIVANETDGIYSDDKIIWEKIKEIMPKKYIDMVSKYEVFTDGVDGDLASVSLNDDDITWTISVDLDDTLDENQNFTSESLKTIIHEASHIISLNSTQMGGNTEDKTLYTVEEGTLKKDAYLNVFYNKFWKDRISEHSKHSEMENTDIENENSFYNKYSDEFVDDYAATNPAEDFAESFMYFVVNEKPVENGIKEEKILFFYDYPEFVKLREDILAKIELE